MTRVNVTLQPSKKTVTTAAARIYAAYIAAGKVQSEEEVEDWINRSVREAVAIARRVDVTVQSDDELPDNGKQRLREYSDDSEYPNVAPQG